MENAGILLCFDSNRSSGYDWYDRLQRVNFDFGTDVNFETLYPELLELPGAKQYEGASLWLLLHTELRLTIRVRRFVDFLSKELIAMQALL